MVALELEVMARKMDRFGWERDRNSAAHDRMLTDWIKALHDFPIGEIQAACATHVIEKPNTMPNEGHIRAQIIAARSRFVAANRKPAPPEPERKRMTAEEVSAILEATGFNLRRMNDVDERKKGVDNPDATAHHDDGDTDNRETSE